VADGREGLLYNYEILVGSVLQCRSFRLLSIKVEAEVEGGEQDKKRDRS
jgi:hypothetical protein